MTNVYEHPSVTPDIPPYSVEAEMGLVAAVLADNTAYDDVLAKYPIEAMHFADPSHQVIWAVTAKLIEHGQAASPVTLKSYLERREELEHVGGTAYLARLAGAVMTVQNASDLAGVVYDLWRRRQMMAAGDTLSGEARTIDYDEPVESILARHAEALDALSAQRRGLGGGVLGDVLARTIADVERDFEQGTTPGIATGLSALDKHIGGLHRGEVTGICARPGMGKSSLVASIALNQAMAGHKVLMLTLEDTPPVIAMRMASRICKVPFDDIRNNRITAEQVTAVKGVLDVIGSLPLWIEAVHGCTGAEVLSRARTMKRQMGGLDVFSADHLMKMTGPGNSPTEIVGRNSKIMANAPADLDAAMLLAVQLNRESEKRENKRPQLSDLRQSGEIEEDLRAAIGLYREAYHALKTKPQWKPGDNRERFNQREINWLADFDLIKHDAELIVMKQNHGQSNVVAHVTFDGPTTTFEG